jgi:hypothetical protein
MWSIRRCILVRLEHGVEQGSHHDFAITFGNRDGILISDRLPGAPDEGVHLVADTGLRIIVEHGTIFTLTEVGGEIHAEHWKRRHCDN